MCLLVSAPRVSESIQRVDCLDSEPRSRKELSLCHLNFEPLSYNIQNSLIVLNPTTKPPGSGPSLWACVQEQRP